VQLPFLVILGPALHYCPLSLEKPVKTYTIIHSHAQCDMHGAAVIHYGTEAAVVHARSLTRQAMSAHLQWCWRFCPLLNKRILTYLLTY